MSAVSESSKTPLHLNLAIGFVVGAAEAYINHPLWALKTRLQTGLPLTLNPRVLYRGVFVHSASSIPLDTLQISLGRIIAERLPYSLEINRFIGGLTGGAFASLISAPSELIMTRQQATGSSARTVVQAILRQQGPRGLLAGFLPTLGRDSLFCGGFFAGVPILKKQLTERGVSDVPASFIAGVAAGVTTALISHPFDTLKSRMQYASQPLSMRHTARAILQESGPLGFLDGLSMRTARVTSGIFLLGNFNTYLEEKILGRSSV